MNARTKRRTPLVVLKQRARADERELREFASRRRIVSPSSKNFPKLRPARFRNIFCERTALRSLRSKSVFSSPGLSSSVNPLFSQAMHRDHQRWYSHRLNRDMGVAIYGNYGAPILAFPTSSGDEWEMESQGMIRTLSPSLEQGRIRIFSINSLKSDPSQNQGAQPS